MKKLLVICSLGAFSSIALSSPLLDENKAWAKNRLNPVIAETLYNGQKDNFVHHNSVVVIAHFAFDALRAGDIPGALELLSIIKSVNEDLSFNMDGYKKYTLPILKLYGYPFGHSEGGYPSRPFPSTDV